MVERKARVMARVGSSASPAAIAIISMEKKENSATSTADQVPETPCGKKPPTCAV